MKDLIIRLVIAGLNLLLVCSIASAATVVSVVSHERDGVVRDYGTNWTICHELVAGQAGGMPGYPVPHNSAILFFELPEVVSGRQVLDASLRMTLGFAEDLSPGEHADLYALGYVRELPLENSIDSRWYYSGALDTRSGEDLGTNIANHSVVRIAEDFVTTSTPIGNVYTNTATNILLTDFTHELYDHHGAQGGDYLVLRVSANQPFGYYHRYRFYSRDWEDPDTWPVLTLTLAPVPEPSAVIMWLGLGAMGLLAAQRRRRHSNQLRSAS